MRLEALKHLARVALEMTGPGSDLLVVGSSSLLGSFPELGDESGPLGASYDADVVPRPFSEEIGTMLHEALGEDRRFHLLHGYCLDVLRPKIGEQFPVGWEERLVEIPELPRVRCLDPHDLAVAKCRTGREKDLELLQFLAKQRKLDLNQVEQRLRDTVMTEAQIVKAFRNFGLVRDGAGQ